MPKMMWDIFGSHFWLLIVYSCYLWDIYCHSYW
jgi:hypothetical protein